MPNGGSDNCGTCWFNRVNDGKTAAELPEPRQKADEPAFCTVRGVDVAGPYWAYCANHQYHNPGRVQIPVGPVYTCGLVYAPRIVQVPGPVTPEVRAGLVDLLASMPEQPVDGAPTETVFDDEIIKHLMKLRDVRAVEPLRRVTRFDPLAATPSGVQFPRNRVSTVAWAVQALGVIAGDAALPELTQALSAGLVEGRQSECARQLAPIRRRAVVGLSHCHSEEAGQLLRRAAFDPDREVRAAAIEAWFVVPSGAG